MHEDGIGSRFVQEAQVIAKLRQFFIIDDRIDRDMDGHIAQMGKADGLAQALTVKIRGIGASTEDIAGQIDSIGSILHGCDQGFPAAGRC